MTEQNPSRPPLHILLAAPRGFCAGVDRAIQIVEQALERHGAPVYVRHEIVHNRFVVDSLKARGAIFVDELDEVPAGAHVVFSARGVPKSVPVDAESRGLSYFDATYPLVSKVHRQAERQVEAGRHIIFVGHRGHPEVIGTFGQVPQGAMTLVETVEDAEAVQIADGTDLARMDRLPRVGVVSNRWTRCLKEAAAEYKGHPVRLIEIAAELGIAHPNAHDALADARTAAAVALVIGLKYFGE